jgi:DNA-binding XRE family transcriptional regulator
VIRMNPQLNSKIESVKRHLSETQMKAGYFLALFLIATAGVWAQSYSPDSIYLKGTVVDSAGKIYPFVPFRVDGMYDFSADATGSIRVALPSKKLNPRGYKYGETITLHLKDKGKGIMVIPLSCGECQLPASAVIVDVRVQTIKLVPKGHPEVENLKLAPCIAASVNQRVETIKSLNKNLPKAEREGPDLDAILQEVMEEFSMEYGLPVEKLEIMLDDWSKQSDEPMLRDERKLHDDFLKDFEGKELMPNATPNGLE